MSEYTLLEIAKAGTGVYRPENKEAELDVTDFTDAEIKELREIEENVLNRPCQTKRYVKYDDVVS